jgi:hypothetical protein
MNALEGPTTGGSSGSKYRTIADAGLSPKSSVPARKCRKSAPSVVAVITGSPYKQQLEIKQNKSKQPKLKTKVSVPRWCRNIENTKVRKSSAAG